MKNSLVFIGGAFFVFILASCSYQKDKTSKNFSSIVPSQKLLSTVDFSMVSQNVFEVSCNECHSGRGSAKGVFTSYESAKASADKIAERALNLRDMPQAGSPPLTQEQLEILAAWIQAGTPEKRSETITPPPTPDKPAPPEEVPPSPGLEPNFDSIYNIILKNKCEECHSPNGRAKKYPFQTRDQLFDTEEVIIIPGEPENSMFVDVMKANPKVKMPPKRSGLAPVSPADIKIIEEWIKNGAKD